MEQTIYLTLQIQQLQQSIAQTQNFLRLAKVRRARVELSSLTMEAL